MGLYVERRDVYHVLQDHNRVSQQKKRVYDDTPTFIRSFLIKHGLIGVAVVVGRWGSI